MEQISGMYTLELGAESFPLSTDSMVLADFVRLPKNAQVLDLGSGCGLLGFLLCAKDPGCTVTGVELSGEAHRCALENIARNQLGHRLYSLCGDLRSMPDTLKKGSFHVCVSNPPYFSGGAASGKHPLARRADCCTVGDLFAAASAYLRFGGSFFLVHKPERLAELCAQASLAGLEPKRLRLVRHRTDSPVCLILLQCKKGARPGLVLDEIALFHPDGTPTEDRRRIYHD